MRAVRYHRGSAGVRLDTVPVPVPGPGEVAVRVEAAGLCGTDVTIVSSADSPLVSGPVVTLGHEAAGTVAACGDGVADWPVGTRVVICPIHTCGACRHCTHGRSELCTAQSVIGLNRDGALADLVVVPAEDLVALPANVPFTTGAILTDAVATPYFALTERARLSAGESVAVFGVGGLGQHAVQLARTLGAERIIALDVGDEQLRLALELGATDAVPAGREDTVAKVFAATGGLGVEVAADFTGRADATRTAFDVLAKGGRLVVVGWGTEPVVLPPSQVFVPRKISVLASGGYRKETIEQVCALVERGELDLGGSISHVLGLAETAQGLELLRDRSIATRRVVVTA